MNNFKTLKKVYTVDGTPMDLYIFYLKFVPPLIRETSLLIFCFLWCHCVPRALIRIHVFEDHVVEIGTLKELR